MGFKWSYNRWEGFDHCCHLSEVKNGRLASDERITVLFCEICAPQSTQDFRAEVPICVMHLPIVPNLIRWMFAFGEET